MIFRQSYAFYLVAARKSLVIFHFLLLEEYCLSFSEKLLLFPGGLLGAVAVLISCLLIVLCHCYVALFKTFKYI